MHRRKLNHLNLTVPDVAAAEEFLAKYFGMRKLGRDARMAALSDSDTDDDGVVLTLMKAGKEATVAYPNTFHIGFFIESKEAVDDIHRRLEEDGFLSPAPKNHNHGYGFYVKAPGGFTIEVGV